MFAPVGQRPEGEERLWKHQAKLCDVAFPHHVLRLGALSLAADLALNSATRAWWNLLTTQAARHALREHFLASYDFLHGREKVAQREGKSGHFSDEPDMLPFPGTLTAAAEETFLMHFF
eukprot:s1543_g17.t1